MTEIDIDFDELPEYIGKRKGIRRDYKVYDMPAIINWMYSQLPQNCGNVDLTVSGKIPAWMWMLITCELINTVSSLSYTTAQMADGVLIFKHEEE